MTLQSDGSVGLVKEVTYGTALTVARFPEFTEAKFKSANDYVQGEGLRVGKIVARQARRSLGQVNVEGSLAVEMATKGMGLLFEAAIGSGVSTVRAGTVYQQLFTPPTTDPMPSYTIQTGTPPIGGGPTIAQTFLGCVCDEWEISAEAGGLVEFSTDWVGKEMLTATAYAAPSYSVNADLFTFVHGSISLGVNPTDALVAPVAIALGSTAAPPSTNITKWSLKGANNVDDGGYVFGSAGKRGRRPVYGLREYIGSFTAEFTAATLRDYYVNQTSLHLVATFVSDQVVFAGTQATMQVVLPAIVLEGDIPESNGSDIITVDVDYTVLDGEVTTSPLYVALVTGDIAL